MRILPLVTLLLLTTAPVYSQEWTQLPTSNPNVRFVIDLGSIEREGDLALFRERLSYDKPDILDETSGMLIREKLVHRAMNCNNKTQGMLSGSMRSDSG
ncbi:MAG: surface-adhesin E family protein, partial [Burkholderiales bacterium]